MRTPLYDEHLKLGAKMTEFAGWDMPLQYAGIAAEVKAVRGDAGIFDLSHMGEFVISGPKALDLVQLVTTNDASILQPGQAQYALMCDENGGVIDDLIVYCLEQEKYLLIVNASNIPTDFEWVSRHNSFGARLENISDKTALIALQGPMSQEILQPLVNIDLSDLLRFNIIKGNTAGVECWVARTGYTGEDGFELLCASDDAVKLWSALLSAGKPFGMQPIGLGARDVLRLEPAYPLYGSELSLKTSPVSARSMWVVKLGKGKFIGREAILKAKEEGTARVLVGLEAVDRCIPRHGSELKVGDDSVGEITSGTFSPTLNKGIAMAYVNREYAEAGNELVVIMGSRACRCRVVRLPFYKR